MTDKDLSLPTSTHLVLKIEVYANKSINWDDFIGRNFSFLHEIAEKGILSKAMPSQDPVTA